MTQQVTRIGVSEKSTSVQVNATNNGTSTSTPDPSPIIKTENSNFEAKGKITSLSGDNFDIEGITITKSPKYQVSISGNIEIGKTVEVKGVLEDGLRYAKEVRVEGAASPTPQASSIPSGNDTKSASAPLQGDLVVPPPSIFPVQSPKNYSQIPVEQPSVSNVAFIADQNVPLPSPKLTFLVSPLPEQQKTFIKPVISFFESWFKSWF